MSRRAQAVVYEQLQVDVVGKCLADAGTCVRSRARFRDGSGSASRQQSADPWYAVGGPAHGVMTRQPLSRIVNSHFDGRYGRVSAVLRMLKHIVGLHAGGESRVLSPASAGL